VRLADNPQPTTFVSGSLGTYQGGGQYIAPSALFPFSLGSITLPPGKWAVNLDLVIFLSMSGVIGNNSYVCPINISCWLQNTSTSVNTYGGGLPIFLPEVSADSITRGSASLLFQADKGLQQGTFLINNTTSMDKTYYLFGVENGSCFDGNVDGALPSYTGGIGSGYPQARFYATKIN
jgi:hypothetical protein